MSVSTADPATGFGQFRLAHILEEALTAAGYQEPRPIQVGAIPAVLEGRDVLGLAQTGTGKTAAFALPLLHRLLEEKNRPGPRVLVVAPTRELAMQIESDFRMLSKGTRIASVTVFGGVSERPQIALLRKRPHVIVACPGRLLDLYNRGLVQLDRIASLVLDEADHMFDMGFLPDIRRIIRALPEERQNLMFSATMPPEIRQLADTVLEDPVVVELTRSTPAETIAHSLLPVPEGRKLDLLQHMLEEDSVFSAIVFTRTKRRAQRLAKQLSKSGHRAVALQGDMSQGARERAMKGFRAHSFDVLVATDIVARGIDVEAVSHVINFDIPGTPEAYTHRIGRTGRAEREGRAYTLVTEADRTMVHSIELMIAKPIPRRQIRGFEGVDLPAPTTEELLSEIARRAKSARGGRRGGSGGGPRGGGGGGSRGGGGPRGGGAGGRASGGGRGRRSDGSLEERARRDRSRGTRGGARGPRREGDGQRAREGDGDRAGPRDAGGEGDRDRSSSSGGPPGPRREGDGHRSSPGDGPRGPRREGDGHRSAPSGGPRGPRREGDGHRSGPSGGPRGPRREGDGHRSGPSGGPRGPRREGDGHRSGPSGGSRGPRREGDGHRSAPSGGPRGPRREGDGHRSGSNAGPREGHHGGPPTERGGAERHGAPSDRPERAASSGQTGERRGGRPPRRGGSQGDGRGRTPGGEGGSASGATKETTPNPKGRGGARKRRRRANSKGAGRDE